MVECSFLNAACSGLIFGLMFLFSSDKMALLYSLESDDKKTIGLKLSVRFRFFPALGIAIMIALFKAVGSMQAFLDQNLSQFMCLVEHVGGDASGLEFTSSKIGL